MDASAEICGPKFTNNWLKIFESTFFPKVGITSGHCCDKSNMAYMQGYIQNQLSIGVQEKRCSWKFCNNHKKTPGPVSLF